MRHNTAALLAAFLAISSPVFARSISGEPVQGKKTPAKVVSLPTAQGKGLKITPENGAILKPGRSITVNVEVLSLAVPKDGVWLSVEGQPEPLVDRAAPYSFEVPIPKEANSQLFSIEARAMAKSGVLSDRASYLVHGGLEKPMLLAILASLALLGAGAFFLGQKLLGGLSLAGLLIMIILVITGYISMRPDTLESFTVKNSAGGSEVSYERNKIIRQPDGKWARKTDSTTVTVTREADVDRARTPR